MDLLWLPASWKGLWGTGERPWKGWGPRELFSPPPIRAPFAQQPGVSLDTDPFSLLPGACPLLQSRAGSPGEAGPPRWHLQPDRNPGHPAARGCCPGHGQGRSALSWPCRRCQMQPGIALQLVGICFFLTVILWSMERQEKKI